MKYKCTTCGFETECNSSPQLCKNCGSTNFNTTPSSAFIKGTVISGYRLINRIGFGGMGEVWLSEQTTMGRLVALKILHPDFSKNPSFTNRFLNEIRHSAKMEHPNIVTAFDAGVYQGIYYLASAYIKGKQLQQKLSEEKVIKEPEALNIALGVAKALDYAWEEFNILHRDIKPGNIIIDINGVPKLLDMGVAKNINEDNSITIDGDVVGTPHYISPEQAKSEQIDFRADIYSLGATLYHISTGFLPYEGATAMSVLAKHITDELVPPVERNSSISPALNNLIIKMMEKKKENRHQSWDQVISNIKGILEGNFPDEEIAIQRTSITDKSKTLTGSASSIPVEALTKILKIQDRKPDETLTNPLMPEKATVKEMEVAEEKFAAAGDKSQRKKERLLFKSILLASCAIIFILLFIFAGIYENSLRQYYFCSLLFDLYNKIELSINTLLSLAFLHTTGKQLLNDSVRMIRISSILYCFSLVGLILASAFYSAAIAEKYLNKLRMPYFLGGLFLPFLFPLTMRKKTITSYISEKTEHSKTSAFATKEDLLSYKYKLFKKISKKDDGSFNGPFTFELSDDSVIEVERITDVKSDLLLLEVKMDSGNSRTMRIPFSNIKTFSLSKK